MTTMEHTTGFVEVDGGRLYYEVSGTGHPLVLVHAGIADTRMWDDQFEAFARHYRVIRYDSRGFGRSETEKASFSNREDLYRLLQHLGAERVYLIGVSRGGHIAVDFTLEHPEMVAALIPVAAGVSGYQHQPAEANRHETEAFAAMDDAWEQRDYDRLTDLEVRLWVDGPGQPVDRADPGVRERVRQMISDGYRQHGTEELTAEPLDPPTIGRLSEIRVPTLIIVGDLDTSATLVMAGLLEHGIEGARRVVFTGTAHMPNMERPEEFNRVVLEFLQGVDRQ